MAAALAAGDLFELFPDHAATGSEFGSAAWLAYPSRRYLPLKVRVFMDYVRAQFAGGAPVEQRLAGPPRVADRRGEPGRVKRSTR